MNDLMATYFTGFFLSAALIMAIGAQNLFVLKQGLKREHVGPVILFCGGVDALLIAAGVGGVGAFLATMPQLSTVLSAAGAAFLLWYGVKAFQRASAPSAAANVVSGIQMPLKHAIAAAAAFTFLNPHVYLDTVLLMGAAGSAQPVEVRPFFIAGAASASFVWFTALGYGARLMTPLFARPVAWRVLDTFVGVIMFALAASLLVSTSL
jgi:L-lysine exporter family protein LysE/ArgO